MRSMMGRATRESMVALTFCALLGAAAANAQGTTNPATDYAWSETVGWINFAPTHGGGVTITEDGNNSYLSGYAWAENVGWIKMGDGTGPYPLPASQTATDWGVNMDADGNMSGYAWSETMGWLNFNATHGQVAMATGSGEFDGYSWGENLGWVSFRDTVYGVLRQGGAVGVPTLNEWGMIALVLALACAAYRRLGQAHQQAA